jgi:hypothetical protein
MTPTVVRSIAALLAFACAGSALAQEAKVEIDTNLICDTQRQVERFVALFDSNQGSAEAAIAAVNAEQDSPEACVIATAAYRRAERVGSANSADARFDIVRIVVVGVHTLNGFEQSSPTTFYTLVPRGEADSTVGQRP